MNIPAPEPQHLWLHRLLGEWRYEVEASMGPGQPAKKFHGVERVRAIGEFWIVGEGTGDMPGGGVARTMLTIGYDPSAGHFVGSWIGSMMTKLWVYEGRLDAAGSRLTLATEGPNCMDPASPIKTARYEEVIAFVNENERTWSSFMLGAGGERTTIMVSTYRRG